MIYYVIKQACLGMYFASDKNINLALDIVRSKHSSKIIECLSNGCKYPITIYKKLLQGLPITVVFYKKLHKNEYKIIVNKFELV